MAEDSGKTGFEYIGPAGHAKAITESDTTYVDPYPRALWVGSAGNLYVDMVGGEKDVPFLNVPAGTMLPIRITKLKAASTVADVTMIW